MEDGAQSVAETALRGAIDGLGDAEVAQLMAIVSLPDGTTSLVAAGATAEAADADAVIELLFSHLKTALASKGVDVSVFSLPDASG